jgi:penicillin-binding protein 2
MPQRIEERVRPITPQLAWRVAVLAGMAFVAFGIVFFRLWFLQVLSGQDYVSIASSNKVRKVPIEAPRGDIVDSNGEKLVATVRAAVVELLPTAIPASVKAEADKYRIAVAALEGQRVKAQAAYDAFDRQMRDDDRHTTKAERRTLRELKRDANKPRIAPIPPLPAEETGLADLYKRISSVLGDPPEDLQALVIRGLADTPYSNITLKTGVPRPEYNYMRERPEKFPGVVVEARDLRTYPHGDLAAQLFGTVSEISDAQLTCTTSACKKAYGGIPQGTRIGQSGLEAEYDKYLRGTDGYTKVTVNAMGQRDDQARTRVKRPVEGQRLKLTLDAKLQQAGDDALTRAIQASRAKYPSSVAGAYVAMDPTNGAILAMGSQPGFDANLFAKPFSQKTYENLTSQDKGAPLLERPTESAYPTGSIFKPVTALAALGSHIISANKVFNDTGKLKIGTQEYQNAKKATLGPLRMSDALKVSSDLYFFQLGADANPRGEIIQREARRLGFGRKTGIDLPGENAGLVPDANWRDTGFAKYTACRIKVHAAQDSRAALYACGGIDKRWTVGDDANLAVGQGDLEATPLQVAVAYSALENNGTIVTPHLGAAIEDSQGRITDEIPTAPRGHVKFNEADRAVVLDGLRRATSEDGGTSADVFKDFGATVYGKTGTAERGINPDQAWYACFVRDGGRPIVVVVTIEKGGFGDETAAPAARLILSQWLHTGDHAFHAGNNKSN